jgi:predicted DsbA family dithiol-disulfide isomerase
MDPITTAIVTALSAGATSGLTEVSKTAVTDAYHRLKSLLKQKFGAGSEVVQAIDHLEAKPESAGRQETLQEEIVAVNAEQDHEVLAAAKQVLTLVHAQQAGLGKFAIQNNAPVQGQNVGDHNTITQQFGELPKA